MLFEDRRCEGGWVEGGDGLNTGADGTDGLNADFSGRLCVLLVSSDFGDFGREI